MFSFAQKGSFYVFTYLIEIELTYNVVLMSAVQRSDSVRHLHIYILFHVFFHGLSQDIE